MNKNNPEEENSVEEKQSNPEVSSESEESSESNNEIIYEDDFEETKSSKKGWIIAGAIVVLILIAFLFWANSSPVEESDILAFVNGQPIYAEEINTRFEQLPEEYKSFVDKEVILNQTIDEVLLLQEAKLQGVVVSEGELTSELNVILEQSMMSKEQFEEYLVNNGMSLDEAFNQIEKSLILKKLFDNIVNVSVYDEEIKFYYEQNKNLFRTIESREVSHILICYVDAQRCETNYTKDMAMELINEVLEKTKTDDFAILAKEYSTGPSAMDGGNLGVVDENTNFIPEFKAVALELNAGEISGVVETDFGFHIIKVKNIIPSNSFSLEEASEQIEAEILNAKTTQFIGEYLDNLKINASIKFLNNCEVDGLIFYTADWCVNCKETNAIVDELIDEGSSITKVMVSDTDLVKTCFGAVMKEQIPQFICKKDVEVGQLSKNEIVNLIEKCK